MNNKKGFTLVELIVVVSILGILATIAFISVGSYIKSTRDSVRLTDMNSIKKSLVYFYLYNGKYPSPDSAQNITYSGAVLWTQGEYGDNARRIAEILPKDVNDPLYNTHYSYSLSADGRQYQIGGVLENNANAYNPDIIPQTYAASPSLDAVILGNYNGLIIRTSTGGSDIFIASPSILTTDSTTTDFIDIIAQNKLIYNHKKNVPHTFSHLESESSNFNMDPSKVVLYSGNLTDFQHQDNQLLLLKNLKEAYSGSTLINDDLTLAKISSIEIDTENPDSIVKSLACNLINYNLKYYNKCSGIDFVTFYVTTVLNIDLGNIPGTKISGVLQDNSGDLWFATDSGLAMFDGADWFYFTNDNSELIHNNVLTIAEDSNHILWFGTNQGISTYDKVTDTWTNITTSNSDLLHNHILSIHTTSNGTIWIGTNKGVSSYNNDTWEAYTKKKVGLSHNHVSTMYEDSSGNVWFGTTSGLDKYNPLDDSIVSYDSSNTAGAIPNDNFKYIIEDSTNTLWVATDGGLSKYDPNSDTWTLYNNSNTSGGLIGDNVLFLFIDSNNILWVGTDQGASKYTPPTNSWIANYDTDNELNGNYIYTISQNDDGDIEILNSGGLNTITN